MDTLLFASVFVFALVFTITQFPWFYGNTHGANLTETLLVAAIPFVFLMLTYTAIGVLMPRTGSDYVWIGRILEPLDRLRVGTRLVLVVFLAAFIGAGTGPLFVRSLVDLLDLRSDRELGFHGQPWQLLRGCHRDARDLHPVDVAGRSLHNLSVQLHQGVPLHDLDIRHRGHGHNVVRPHHDEQRHLHQPLEHARGRLQLHVHVSGARGYRVQQGLLPRPSYRLRRILLALPFAFLFLFGGNYANSFAGEIKTVKKSLPIALFLSLVLGLAYWITTSTLTTHTIGFNWATIVGYGWIQGGSVPSTASYPLPFQPTQPLFLAVAAYGNNTLITLMVITYFIGSLGPVRLLLDPDQIPIRVVFR